MLFLDAPRRITARVALLTLVGNAAIALCIAAWLQIPDARAWQLLASALCGALIVASLLWLYADVLRSLRRADAPISLWLSAALVAAWLTIWISFARLIGLLNNQLVDRAYFWNSRLSAHNRIYFTSARLISWQETAVAILLWWLLPSLLLPAMMETVVRGLRKYVCALRVYRRLRLWLSVAISAFAGATLSGKLIQWHPSYTVRGEVVSAVLRLGLAYLLLATLALIVAAVVAELLHRASRSPGHSPPEP